MASKLLCFAELLLIAKIASSAESAAVFFNGPVSTKATGILWCGSKNGFAKDVPVQLHYHNETAQETVIATRKTNRRGRFDLEGAFLNHHEFYAPAIYLEATINGKHCNGDELCTQHLIVEIPWRYVSHNRMKTEEAFDLGIWNLQTRNIQVAEMCA